MKLRYLGPTDEIALVNGKEYIAVGENSQMYLVVDETGGEYLYPKELFAIVEDSRSIRQ